VTAETDTPRGNIYDLGYRHFEGEKLGRSYAFWSLVRHSLRGVFGLGRSTMTKVFSIGFAVIALIPAAIQLGVATLSPAEIEVIVPEDYFGVIQVVLGLFCAAVAPELIGRDQRTRTLPLYFSRALSRADYVSAKVVAMIAGLLIVIIVPQAVMFIGNSVSTTDSLEYMQDNIGDIPRILASAVLIAVYMTAVSLALASITSRRAISSAIVLASFVFLTIFGEVLVQTSGEDSDLAKVFILISPMDTISGAIYWIFDAPLPSGESLEKAGLAGWAYVVAAVATAAAALAYLYRRYLRLAV
jgi:ABC-2 type transport system permease protein